MKKLINYSLIFAFSILSISCSKDSSSPTPTVTGKWHLSQFGQKGTGTTIIWENADDPGEPCSTQNYFEFKSNGEFVEKNYSTNATTNACEEDIDPDAASKTKTWIRTGDDVTMTTVDATTTPPTTTPAKIHIISLTDSNAEFQGYDLTGTALTDYYFKFVRIN